MGLILVNDILKIFALSVLVLLIFGKLRIPAIVGFLVTGILAGPHGFGLIRAIHEVEILAEIGIVFLLFTIGIHFSMRELLTVKKSVLMGGTLQVLLTTLIAFAIMQMLGWGLASSIFSGWLLALSSTAIVLKLLEERAETDTPHGRNALAILIFQDIIIFPMILFTPVLAGVDGNVGETSLLLIAKIIGMVVLVILSARYIVPKILQEIVKTRSSELFLLTVVVICFAVAWLTFYSGLSLSLGAFLAGLIISESEYSHQALGNVLPFRDLFLSLFFVSVGMLLDIAVLFEQPLLILAATIGVLLLKTILAGFSTFILGFPLRTCVITGVTLSQVGEFSFILSKTGLKFGLIPDDSYQLFLSVSLLTMAATPFIIAAAPRLGDWIAHIPLPTRIREGLYPVEMDRVRDQKHHLKDHLIIIGYGLNGQNVAKAATMAGVPYVIIEMNPETVRAEREKSEPIFYGDASQRITLEHVNIESCRDIVIAISDAAATRKITDLCRRVYPHVYIIARTRFLKGLQPLHELGAHEVIPEEFETSVEIFTRVLKKYLIPNDRIEKFTAELRSNDYRMLRKLHQRVSISDLKLHIPDIEICTLTLPHDSPFAGKTLGELDLRNRYDVTALLVQRGEGTYPQPKSKFKLAAADRITVFGQPQKIADLDKIFKFD
jgi:CPA2 family monovalent cation:H+ antiporter-2